VPLLPGPSKVPEESILPLPHRQYHSGTTALLKGETCIIITEFIKLSHQVFHLPLKDGIGTVAQQYITMHCSIRKAIVSQL